MHCQHTASHIVTPISTGAACWFCSNSDRTAFFSGFTESLEIPVGDYVLDLSSSYLFKYPSSNKTFSPPERLQFNIYRSTDTRVFVSVWPMISQTWNSTEYLVWCNKINQQQCISRNNIRSIPRSLQHSRIWKSSRYFCLFSFCISDSICFKSTNNP